MTLRILLAFTQHGKTRQSTAQHSAALCGASAGVRCFAELSFRTSQGAARRCAAVSYGAAVGY